MSERLLDMNALKGKLALSHETIYCLIREGTFPKPVKLRRASRWIETEIDRWIYELAAEREVNS